MTQTPERNSPCPCGSGKKYKKCCMLKPSGIANQMPFPFSAQQNGFTFSSHTAAFPDKDRQSSGDNENESSSDKKDSYNNNVPVVNLLDMSNAAEVIEKLEMDDLRTLHKLIVNRINKLVNSKNENTLAKFCTGNRVRFKSRDGTTKTGTVIRVNQKTVSIIVDGDEDAWWKVSPQVVERI